LLLQNSCEQYRANFKTALIFALLLVFVPVFNLFQNIYSTSGTIFLDYGLLLAPPEILGMEVLLVALFLLFYSFFVSIIVFSVRKNLSKLKLQVYLHEMIQKFALRVFVFYVVYSLLLFLLVSGLLTLGFGIFPISLAIFVISFLLMFVPQAVVIDEEGLRHAVSSNFEFLFHFPKSFATILVVGAILVALLQIVEFGLSFFTVFSQYFSILISLVFIVPFLEIMKTYQYMMRFELIKHHEAARRKKPLSPRFEPDSLANAPKP